MEDNEYVGNVLDKLLPKQTMSAEEKIQMMLE